METADKTEIVNALIDIKLALNSYYILINNTNVNALNESDLIDYDNCKNGFESVNKIAKIVKSS